MCNRSYRWWIGMTVVAVAGLVSALPTWAVPSFARQTGMACEACHTIYPELNHFGRVFKASGYTLDNLNPVRGVTSEKREMLALTGLPPISLMVQVSGTWLGKQIPDSTAIDGHAQNGTIAFPQQISLFYAGKIAPYMGAFIQLTYGYDSGSIGIDNTDLRYANALVLPGEQSLIYGVSLNNNPTVQDLWNSTPAFGFPYASSKANVSPLAATQIDGALAQDVAGMSVYAFWKESLYGEVGVYRSAKQGVSNPITGAAGPLDGSISNVLRGTAPYFRLAYEHQWGRNSLELGVYGMNSKLLPGGRNPANPTPQDLSTNQFKDVAEDFQYQYIGERHLFSISGTRIHEQMTLDASFGSGASANRENDLTTWRAFGTYYYLRKVGGTLGVFSTTGSTDATLYPAGAAPGVVTSANGKPDTSGWMAELNYVPWLNTKLSLQYTRYRKFNGGRDNYDGFGRDGKDNNTIYALVWITY